MPHYCETWHLWNTVIIFTIYICTLSRGRGGSEKVCGLYACENYDNFGWPLINLAVLLIRRNYPWYWDAWNIQCALITRPLYQRNATHCNVNKLQNNFVMDHDYRIWSSTLICLLLVTVMWAGCRRVWGALIRRSWRRKPGSPWRDNTRRSRWRPQNRSQMSHRL